MEAGKKMCAQWLSLQSWESWALGRQQEKPRRTPGHLRTPQKAQEPAAQRTQVRGVIISLKSEFWQKAFKHKSPRLPADFTQQVTLLQLPLLQKHGGSLAGRSKTENLGTVGNKTQLRAGIPYWKQGTWSYHMPLPPGLLPSGGQTSPSGQKIKRSFLEIEQFKSKDLKIPSLGLPRKQPHGCSLQSKVSSLRLPISFPASLFNMSS